MSTPTLLAPLAFLLIFGLTGTLAGAVYSRTWGRDRSIFVDAAIGGGGWVAVWVFYWFLADEWPSPMWNLRQATVALLVAIGVIHMMTIRSRLNGSAGTDRRELSGNSESGAIPPRR